MCGNSSHWIVQEIRTHSGRRVTKIRVPTARHPSAVSGEASVRDLPQMPGSVVKGRFRAWPARSRSGPDGAPGASQTAVSNPKGGRVVTFTKTTARVARVHVRRLPGGHGPGTGHDRHVLRDGD